MIHFFLLFLVGESLGKKCREGYEKIDGECKDIDECASEGRVSKRIKLTT
jgi:hypothetical protein